MCLVVCAEMAGLSVCVRNVSCGVCWDGRSFGMCAKCVLAVYAGMTGLAVCMKVCFAVCVGSWVLWYVWRIVFCGMCGEFGLAVCVRS